MEGINFNAVLLLSKKVPALHTVQSVCGALLLCSMSLWVFGVPITWPCCRSAHGAVFRFMLTAEWGWVTWNCMLQQRPRSLAFPAATRLILMGPGCLGLGR